MTVAENIAFGLEGAAAAPAPVARGDRRPGRGTAGLVQLDGLGKRYPSQLLRRPAPARGAGPRAGHRAAHAAAGRAVRRAGRQGAQGTARLAARIHDRTGVTTSSSPTTRKRRFALADLVAVMNDGRIEQIGTPQEVRRAPKRGFVEDFLRSGESVSRHKNPPAGAGLYGTSRLIHSGSANAAACMAGL